MPSDHQSSWTNYDPTLTNQGAYVVPQQFLWPTGNFSQINNDYASFGVWIYHIQGQINKILDINIDLATSSGSILTDFMLVHSTSLSGVVISIDKGSHNFTMSEQIQTGWNWLGIGVNYTTVFWSQCNQHQ